MENLNIDLAQIGTLAGLSGVTTVLTGAIKWLFRTTGHGTVLCAVAVAFALSIAWNLDAGTLHSAMDFIRIAAYSLVAAATAGGFYGGATAGSK